MNITLKSLPIGHSGLRWYLAKYSKFRRFRQCDSFDRNWKKSATMADPPLFTSFLSQRFARGSALTEISASHRPLFSGHPHRDYARHRAHANFYQHFPPLDSILRTDGPVLTSMLLSVRSNSFKTLRAGTISIESDKMNHSITTKSNKSHSITQCQLNPTIWIEPDNVNWIGQYILIQSNNNIST
jgi:hypothetical protein